MHIIVSIYNIHGNSYKLCAAKAKYKSEILNDVIAKLC